MLPMLTITLRDTATQSLQQTAARLRTTVADSTFAHRLLLVLPATLTLNDAGVLSLDRRTAADACEWVRAYGSVTIAAPVVAGPAPEDFVMLTDVPELAEVNVVPLPSPTVLGISRQRALVNDILDELVDSHTHLVFVLGDRVGDWGAQAASRAMRKSRRFAVDEGPAAERMPGSIIGRLETFAFRWLVEGRVRRLKRQAIATGRLSSAALPRYHSAARGGRPADRDARAKA